MRRAAQVVHDDVELRKVLVDVVLGHRSRRAFPVGDQHAAKTRRAQRRDQALSACEVGDRRAVTRVGRHDDDRRLLPGIAQAAQQASRVSAGEELADALLAQGHARWHEAAGRLTAASAARGAARHRVEGILAELGAADELVGAVTAQLEAWAADERTLRDAHERSLAARSAAELRRPALPRCW